VCPALSFVKPGSLVKSSIPMKTWAECDDTGPGFIEVDLVGDDSHQTGMT